MKTKLLSITVLASCSFAFAQTSVTSATTGKVWLDRNLGATQVATSLSDANAYGGLYEWGRKTDGHQLRTATTVAGQVAAGSEGSSFYYDQWAGNWLTVADDTRWQTGDVTNNPCPSGYRVPTSAEFIAEGFADANAAFASNLKLPYTGFRSNGDGIIYDVSSTGYYWTSTMNGSNAIQKYFSATGANDWGQWRSAGLAVRCIYDATLSINSKIKVSDLNMYPNPVNSNSKIYFSVAQDVNKVKVEVYNVTGQIIYTQNSEARTIELLNASKGVYLIKFTLDNDNSIVKELIVK
jgi:hypothetical protein